MLDRQTIEIIEAALANGKRVEVAVEYRDKENKIGPQAVVVEIGRRVLAKRNFNRYSAE